MLDNRLCLISVVEFLRRSRVDRDTREGKVVVGTDLSTVSITKTGCIRCDKRCWVHIIIVDF